MSMSTQQIFNTVVEHAKKQGAKCDDKSGTCYYRHPSGSGLMCFGGVLIKDDHYSVALENKAADSWAVLEALFLSGVLGDATAISDDDSGVESPEVKLIRRLQVVHDIIPVGEWSTAFEDIAMDYQLEYTP